MFHRLATLLWVTRTIGKEESVELQLVEVVVPRHTNHLDATSNQAADDVGLYTAVDKYHFLLSTFIIADNIFTAYLFYPVHRAIVLFCLLRFHRSSFYNDLSHHDTVFAEHFGQSSCINACNGRNLFAFQPRCQRLFGIPVAILFAIVGYYQCLGMDAVALHEQGQPIATHTCIRYTVVANQWKCRYQYLSCIAGVCQTLRIARHGSIKYHLANRLGLITERASVEYGAVAEYQSCFSHYYLFFCLLSMYLMNASLQRRVPPGVG